MVSMVQLEVDKHTKSLLKTAIETRCPSRGSAYSDRCQLSQSFKDRVMGTEKGRPRAKDILAILAVLKPDHGRALTLVLAQTKISRHALDF